MTFFTSRAEIRLKIPRNPVHMKIEYQKVTDIVSEKNYTKNKFGKINKILPFNFFM